MAASSPVVATSVYALPQHQSTSPRPPPPADIEDILSHHEKKKKWVRSGIPVHCRVVVWPQLTSTNHLIADQPRLFLRHLKHTFGFLQGDTIEDCLGELRDFTPRSIPWFGGEPPFSWAPLTEEGKGVVRILLCVLAQNIPLVTYCPCLAPLVAVLLLYVPVAEAYLMAYHMTSWSSTVDRHRVSSASVAAAGSLDDEGRIRCPYRYVPVNDRQCVVLTDCFLQLAHQKCDFLKKCNGISGVLREMANEWFRNLFFSVLPFPIALQLFDTFLCEGTKIYYRAGLGVLKVLKPALLKCTTLDEYAVVLAHNPREWTSGDALAKKSFKTQLSRKELDETEQACLQSVSTERPTAVGLYHRPRVVGTSSVLSRDQWELFFTWLPRNQSVGEFHLVFSTAMSGYSFTSLYHACCDVVSTKSVVLVQGVPAAPKGLQGDTPATDGETPPSEVVLGAYNTSRLEVSPKFAGSGYCFVFTMKPEERIFRWPHLAVDAPAAEGDVEEKNHRFIYAERERLRFGFGESGSAIDFHEGNLQSGQTSECETYNSPPLVPGGVTRFDVSQIEVWVIE